MIPSFVLAAFIAYLCAVSAEPAFVPLTYKIQQSGNVTATVSEIATAFFADPTAATSYFVTKKYSDPACSILITGTSTTLGACLPVFVNSGYTKTTSTTNYASTITYSDSACTVSPSAEKTMFLSDSCVFDASSGYLKTSVTATPSFVSSSEGAIAR